MFYVWNLSIHFKYQKCEWGDYLFSLGEEKKVSFKKKWKPVFSSEDKAAFLFNKHNKMVQTFLFPIKIFYHRILYLIYL